jgi:hypothetical protein
MAVSGQHHAIATLLPGKDTHCIGVGWPQRRSGRVWKILPAPGFDLWTVEAVATALFLFIGECLCMLLCFDNVLDFPILAYPTIRLLTDGALKEVQYHTNLSLKFIRLCFAALSASTKLIILAQISRLSFSLERVVSHNYL